MRIYCVFACFFYTFSIFAQTVESESGTASFYAHGFNGRLTSFGEKFNTKELTAAHRKLPYNSIVKVTNTSNNKYVIVRINDRGPHTKNRILDLSPAAAEKLDMIDKGIAKVTIEILRSGVLASDSLRLADGQCRLYGIYNYKIGKTYSADGIQSKPKGYCVHIISTGLPDSAAVWIDSLHRGSFKEVYTQVTSENKKIKYNIVLGAYSEKTQASRINDTLKKYGINGFIKKYIASKNGN